MTPDVPEVSVILVTLASFFEPSLLLVSIEDQTN